MYHCTTLLRKGIFNLIFSPPQGVCSQLYSKNSSKHDDSIKNNIKRDGITSTKEDTLKCRELLTTII
ncbi:hypothetical protein KUTeg_006797 [Tegillarca granosa]|uniref:Uncharacterized protein n=1 Tax=Tegillarca granosa TaxID=220873 RepID=A0ABQ9FBD0_TEGGR|nr:hypothetical protein KUTeg_006797 [Tegillarca granosa]